MSIRVGRYWAVPLAVAVLACSIVSPLGRLMAQQGDAAAAASPAADAATAGEEAAPPEDAYTEEELDDLVAPVALYPDSLLAQVLVASTYPLEIVKAQRWADGNAELADQERADAAQQEGWDPSVTVLAAGFPTVLKRMADDIEWTEQLGDAMLVQDSDVLDAVQRQRARAAAAGNLETNKAQKVETADDQITISPADPNVVYVPVYDTQSVYTEPATQTVVEEKADDTKYTGGEMVLTGVLAFGAGMIVNEIFDDDDDDWGNYWRGPPPVYWGGGTMYPRPGRPGINVGGDVNINVDRNTNIGDRGDGWKPDERQKAKAKRNIEQRNAKVTDRKGTATGRPAAAPAKAGGAAASLESRMKKREAAAPAARPAAERPKAKATGNAFAGSREDGTAARKALNRGKASTGKPAEAVRDRSRDRDQDRDRSRAGPERKSGPEKHKVQKRQQPSAADRAQGRDMARGGGRRER